MMSLAKFAEESDEPPVAYPGAAPDSERARQPPLPEVPYKPYGEKPHEAPYKPYTKKPTIPYEPYKGL